MLTQFGKYTLEKKLGQGGMGAVYLALDSALNRRVALKIITSDDPELLERFQREASAVAKLKHPNIVQVYEAGAVGKQHYFTMDYIEGVSLEKYAGSASNIQNIAKIIFQVAAGLQYAHSQKIVHRDIKPANIMIDKQGKVYIADFGLAKQLTGLDRSLTMTGTALGTPDYMSPEQAMGHKDELDHRADIFSLGATLYFCLTRRTPFSGKELYELLNKVINDDPPAPSSIVKIIPKDLETICLKCMEKDKAKRYQTAAGLAGDIKKYLRGESITARRTSTAAKLWIKATKNKAASLAIAGAVVILIAVVIGFAISSAGRKNEIAAHRAKAESAFTAKKYDDARTWCNKVLALAPGDEAIKGVLEKCEAEITARETALNQDKARAEAEARKIKEAQDTRNRAKAALDQAAGAPTPDQKITLAQEAIAIDPAFGDAYQVIGYAYKAKAAESGLSPDERRELWDKAYEAFTKAIEATPTLAYSYYERAKITDTIRDSLKDAIPDYEKVLKYDPEGHFGWNAKGRIEYTQNKYDQSIESITRAIAIYSDDDYAYTTRGAVYSEKAGRVQSPAEWRELMDKAIADLNKAISLNPQNANAYNNRSVVYMHKAEREPNPGVCLELIDKAIADLDETIRLKPIASSYTNRGVAYKRKGEFDKAVADFNEALKLDPKYIPAYYNRGGAYATKGELDLAIIDFNKAIELNPNSVEAYANRGAAYRGKGELDRAIEDFNKAIELNPNSAQAYANRGIAYADKGEFDQAIADYTKAIELNPNDSVTYSNRGLSYVNRGEIDPAIADYTKAIELVPKDALAYYNRGNAYKKKAELTKIPDAHRELFDRAIADYTKAIELNPKNGLAYYNRATAYVHKAECKLINSANPKELLDLAISDYDKAIELDPKNAPAYYSNRGGAYSDKGQADRAIQDYTKAIELNPNLAEAYYNRSYVYAGKKDYQKAIADGERFLELVYSERGESAPNHPSFARMKKQIEEWQDKLK
ncbi:MAG: tetratricopeptide repeat protein [Planctomycetota bacterium]